MIKFNFLVYKKLVIIFFIRTKSILEHKASETQVKEHVKNVQGRYSGFAML